MNNAVNYSGFVDEIKYKPKNTTIITRNKYYVSPRDNIRIKTNQSDISDKIMLDFLHTSKQYLFGAI